MANLLFSTFPVTNQSFYRAAKTFAIVNLMPIVPGHVLVVPNRVVPRLSDLDDEELGCLMRSLKRVGSVVEKAYGGDSLTVALQDGVAAGQTVPHVHFHIIPRKNEGDPFKDRNDMIYPEIERNERAIESRLNQGEPKTIQVDPSAGMKPRTQEDMEKEATWLRSFFTEENS
ncbi:diadenosine 5',5'''-P1,P4-tetraphosphate asymmetrical hydrolase [Crepidotus variabilis]|uniref:Diadenosine 5',5'''-P1,P4-tetraphosphate asymmetrical hydrolase n=1 Tax=Crepidotus variabilis TaxID=179855 RepID=A0A9P6EMZ9_9AGAR|nr:diadenosine 5',5'''-P1,P4-tetraphosphate asymmetrical hydrolase [Crepidotus variabilis]